MRTMPSSSDSAGDASITHGLSTKEIAGQSTFLIPTTRPMLTGPRGDIAGVVGAILIVFIILTWLRGWWPMQKHYVWNQRRVRWGDHGWLRDPGGAHVFGRFGAKRGLCGKHAGGTARESDG